MKRWIFLAVWLGLPLFNIQAQEQAITNETAVVMFHGKELITVSRISSVSADTRAETLLRRFKRQAKSPLVSTEKFSVHHDDQLKVSVIMSGEEILCAAWEVDAEYHNVPRVQLAEHWRDEIKKGIEEYRKDYTSAALVKDSIFATIATLIFLIIWFIVRKVCRKEIAVVGKKFAGREMFKFLDGDSIVTINGNIVRFIRFIIMAWVFVI